MKRAPRRLLLTAVLCGAWACGDTPSTAPTPNSVCGNGVVEAGELCDDGNGIDTDACPDGEFGTCAPATCGDGVIFAGSEACDDGVLNSDNTPGACRADCSAGFCGDGVVDLLEACDDGNGVLTDGCPDGANGTCELAACGDGFLQAGLETCDDGGSNSDAMADACRTDCQPAHCGDGTRDTGEVCDDGNQSNADNCPDGDGGSCAPGFCGDGFVLTASESCDDGANNSNTAADACRSNCQPAACGDGVLDSGEACDAGGLNSDTTPDACRTTCALAGCGDGVADSVDVCDLEVDARNMGPTRLVEAADGNIYVTDAQGASVFIYDSSLVLFAQLKNVNRPLGIAAHGTTLYVGSNDDDVIHRYSTAGENLGSFGQGQLQMPNDLTIDAAGNIYVADSVLNRVKVFAPDGTFLRDIGIADDGDSTWADGELSFPVAVTVAYRTGFPNGELYVGDQRHYRIVVFDLSGNYLRSYGEARVFDDDWQGKFVTVQSLQVDSNDRLHVTDSQQAHVQILDADSGTYLGHYGALGEGIGELNLPLDIWITADRRVVVANNANHRVEVVYSIP